jgi:4'-phosphopantetheinyl transferase
MVLGVSLTHERKSFMNPSAPHPLDLWQLDLDDPLPLARCTSYLSEAEQIRAAKFYFPRDRHRYTLGRGIMRAILAEYLEIPPAAVVLNYNPYGKPHLVPQTLPPLYFNLSHSDGVGILAVTHIGEIGVDIEYCRALPNMDEMAKLVFSPWEYARWRTLPSVHQSLGFYRGWTCKEAYMKGVGMGFSLASNSFDIAFLPDEATRLRLANQEPSHQWLIMNFQVAPTLMGAYALKTNMPATDIKVQFRHYPQSS